MCWGILNLNVIVRITSSPSSCHQHHNQEHYHQHAHHYSQHKPIIVSTDTFSSSSNVTLSSPSTPLHYRHRQHRYIIVIANTVTLSSSSTPLHYRHREHRNIIVTVNADTLSLSPPSWQTPSSFLVHNHLSPLSSWLLHHNYYITTMHPHHQAPPKVQRL